MRAKRRGEQKDERNLESLLRHWFLVVGKDGGLLFVEFIGKEGIGRREDIYGWVMEGM